MIAEREFGGVSSAVPVRQVRVPGFSDFQFVIARHKEFGAAIADFVAVEIPDGENDSDGAWRCGIADLPAKCALMERWGRRMYCVLEERALADLGREIRLDDFGSGEKPGVVFVPYAAQKGGRVVPADCSAWRFATSARLSPEFPVKARKLSEAQFVESLRKQFTRQMRGAMMQFIRKQAASLSAETAD